MTATAADVMNPELTVIQHTDTVDHAVRVISDNRYRNLPIVDENRCYLGVISIHSILTKILPKAALMGRGLHGISFMHETIEHLGRRLDEVRNEPVTVALCKDARVVAPTTPLLQTLLVLYRSRQSVAVVETQTRRLQGMVSYFDVEARIFSASQMPPEAGA